MRRCWPPRAGLRAPGKARATRWRGLPARAGRRAADAGVGTTTEAGGVYAESGARARARGVESLGGRVRAGVLAQPSSAPCRPAPPPPPLRMRTAQPPPIHPPRRHGRRGAWRAARARPAVADAAPGCAAPRPRPRRAARRRAGRGRAAPRGVAPGAPPPCAAAHEQVGAKKDGFVTHLGAGRGWTCALRPAISPEARRAAARGAARGARRRRRRRRHRRGHGGSGEVGGCSAGKAGVRGCRGRGSGVCVQGRCSGGAEGLDPRARPGHGVRGGPVWVWQPARRTINIDGRGGAARAAAARRRRCRRRRRRCYPSGAEVLGVSA
jgi:hypothetical protein